MSARTVYLDNVSLEEAWALFRRRLAEAGWLKPGPREVVDVTAAHGRVTAEPVYAKVSSPHYHAAAMDGVAVQAAATFGASETCPKRLRLGREAVYVDTGDPLPPGYDAVIKVEEVQELPDGEIEIIDPAAPWQHIRTIGEDITATEMLFPENHRIRAVDVGAMISAGVQRVLVRHRPRVAIIPTGDEIIEDPQELAPGKILESNSWVQVALVSEWGGQAVRYQVVPDDLELLVQALGKALEEADLVVINAGSSAGREDFTAEAIARVGEVLVHGVAIKPGKPLILGLARGTPVVGIPGYPVSAYLNFNLFVRPLVYERLGLEAPAPTKVRATISRKVVSGLGAEEFLRVTVGKIGDRLVASPLARGAGVITSLVRADGIVRIPASSEGFSQGREVEVELLRPPDEIEKTVVVTGSHDVALDVLAACLRQRYPGYRLTSAHVGSLGGMAAVKRGEAHMAGIHLLDGDTGTYNLPYVKRLLPGREVVLVRLVNRTQGLMVAPGNPKNIRGFADLARNDVRFVNRQRGAGTRILLDYELQRIGLKPEDIDGYERHENTHMAVAAAVAGGAADVGLGILAAARALKLDFIPVTQEEYDLVVPREHYETRPVQQVCAVIQSDDFKERVLKLGGYDVSETGQERVVTG